MPITIFICYAREDEQLLHKLETHLKPLQRQGLVDMWYDREINAGTEWESEIDKHLNSSQIILLLVSPDFMNSDYCYGTELKRALERHERNEAQVIPIILRPTDLKGTSFVRLQALPKHGKPVTVWSNRDVAFLDVAESIRNRVNELLKNSQIAITTTTIQPSISAPISNIYNTHPKPLGDLLKVKVADLPATPEAKSEELPAEPHVLIADDDIRIATYLSEVVRQECGCKSTVVYNGKHALALAKSYSFDLILLDYFMAGLDGLEVVRRLRKAGIHIPIIMISTGISSKVQEEIFELSVDYFIKKPVEIDELIEKVDELLRKSRFNQKEIHLEEEVLHFDDLHLNTVTCELVCVGRVFDLNATEYKLLYLFMSHPQQILDRPTIIKEVWGDDFHGDTTIIEVYIRLLREKIEVEPSIPRLIHTVKKGVGYMLTKEIP